MPQTLVEKITQRSAVDLPAGFEVDRSVAVAPRAAVAGTAQRVSIVEGFPREMTGRFLYIPKDNLDTDGIYGKDYTYNDNMTPGEMAAVAMLSYDPEFQQKAQCGDILVGGSSFGKGSSREQAATSLKYRGIQLIIAESFSQTYSRTAFNKRVHLPALPRSC